MLYKYDGKVWAGSEHGPVTSSYEYDNKHSGFIKDEEYFD
jgi:hypothetical protein